MPPSQDQETPPPLLEEVCNLAKWEAMGSKLAQNHHESTEEWWILGRKDLVFVEVSQVEGTAKTAKEDRSEVSAVDLHRTTARLSMDIASGPHM